MVSVPKIECTITFLEMLAPPGRTPAKPLGGPGLGLMLVEKPTVPFYRFLYNTIGAEWLWFERRLMSDAKLESIIQDPKVEVWVLYCGGQPAGYAELDFRPQASRDTVDLSYFGLMPAFIGQRLGPFLLDSALQRAWSSEPRRVTVNTNTMDHPRALPLYQRFGFRPIRRETRVFDDPRATGLMG